MATIQLTDAFGLNVTLNPDPTSVFNKYIKGLTGTNLAVKDTKQLSGETVGGYPFTTQTVGLSFQQPVPLGTTGVQLTIKPSVSGSVVVNSGKDVLDKTLFDKPEAKALMDQKYLTAALSASLEANLKDKSGDLQFGFNAGSSVALMYSQPVNSNDELASSLKTTLEKFTIPGDLEDLDGMPDTSISSVQGTGTLTFSGSVNLLMVANPLATVATGVTSLGKVGLKQTAGIILSAAVKLTGGYQIQVSKLPHKRALLSFSRTNGKELDVSVSGEVGLNGAVGNFDIIKELLRAVSPDAVPPADELKQLGISDDEIGAISKAIKAGLQRSLQVSLAAELDLSDQNTKAFLYEIDLNALDEAARNAVHSALDGDLSGLHTGPLAGVTPLRSVITALKDTTRKLNLNLLGILNKASISDLIQSSTVIVDPDTGDITIMDKTSASEVGLTLNNFAEKGKQLRRIVADGFLTTATYRAAKGAIFTSNITSQCWAFALHQTTTLDQIKDYLNIAVSLKLLSLSDADKMLAEAKTKGQLGRSLFQASSIYDDALFHSLFFDGDQVRDRDYYESKGRQAMLAVLLTGDPITPARRAPLTDDALWKRMKDAGQFNFPTIFNKYNSVEVANIDADYTVIRWWAESMHNLGTSLSELLTFLKTSGIKDPKNNTFITRRGNLDDELAAVANNTHDQFGEPWGLLSMDLASGQKSATSLLVKCPGLNLSLSRPQTAPVLAEKAVAG